MLKNHRRGMWIAIFIMGLLAPCIHAQSTEPPASATTTPDVVSGTDPEPISPHLIDVLLIVLGIL